MSLSLQKMPCARCELRSRRERELAVEFAKILMEGMPPLEIAAKLERFELICEQREASPTDLLLPAAPCLLAGE